MSGSPIMEGHVLERYSAGARTVQEALCCPVSYDRNLLALLPAEIVERDYGCGDPSRYVRPGDTVLDLGSGGGKICYMAAQLVGPGGRVIGVDLNDDMLALARRHRAEMARRLGDDLVDFRKCRIQDLALDLERAAAHRQAHPELDEVQFRQWQAWLRGAEPAIADQSVDLVISNCVLNLVEDADKRQLVREIHRVLKPGGRAAISDIVADEAIPAQLKADPELWSGCLSGAFHEAEFLRIFREEGFTGVTYDQWSAEPWRVVDGIEFRSVTLTAIKDGVQRQTDGGHAVIYRGPFAVVEDEQGNRYPAGERMAVSAERFQRLGQAPFADQFILLAPKGVSLPRSYALPKGAIRPAAATRGGVCRSPVDRCC